MNKTMNVMNFLFLNEHSMDTDYDFVLYDYSKTIFMAAKHQYKLL